MIEGLSNTAFLQGFSDKMLEELASYVEVQRFHRDELIFRDGDEGKCMYVVEKGTVEISKRGKVLTVLEAGDTFGGMALIEGERRSADAVSKGNTSVYKIDGDRFQETLLNHPQDGVGFLIKGITEMSLRLRQTSEYLVTVFETGRIVGGDYYLDEMAGKIVDRLLESVEDSTGGVVLLYSPFVEKYVEACQKNVGQSVMRNIITVIDESEGAEIDISGDDGPTFGVPLKDSNRILGYIVLHKDGGSQPFSTKQRVIISAVGSQVELGILKAYNRQEDEARQRLQQRSSRMMGEPI